MSLLTDFIVNWGDVVELDFPKMDLNKVKEICLKSYLTLILFHNLVYTDQQIIILVLLQTLDF